jgi:hypothetical protein
LIVAVGRLRNFGRDLRDGAMRRQRGGEREENEKVSDRRGHDEYPYASFRAMFRYGWGLQRDSSLRPE